MSTVALSVVNNITATANQTAVGGTTQDPIIAIANNAILPGTGSFVPPVGNTAQRVLRLGAMRFNSQTGFFECSTDNATWTNLAVGGGGIASVTGTALQIDCTAGPNVVVSIDAGYVGQTSITTLGTITTGVWNGTNIPLNHGGTNAALVASNGGLVYSTAGAMAILAGTATANQIPLSGSNAAPNWSTATYPATTTINQLLYSSAANTIAGLATANNGTLVTSSAGVPSILVGPGTTGNILQSNAAAAPSFSTATYPSSTTINQILYSSAANTVTGLATANNGVLTTGATGIPVITGLGTDGQLIIGSSAGAPAAATLTAGSGVTITNGHNSITIAATGSGGTVTSVSGTAPIASTGGNTPVISLNGTATAGQVLQSVTATTTAYSTPTYPSASGSAGTILRSDGTNNVYSTATFANTYSASNLLYSNGANTVTGLATANSAVLVTSSAGVPSLSSTMTNGQLIIGSTGATPTAATITAGAGITVTNGAGSITVAATAVTANQTYLALGRLTLTTNVPVTTSDVTAATTLYFTPYKGDEIALYDGSTTWNVIQFTQLSISVPNTTSTMYDAFVFNNSGTATLELLAWTNDTTRATALVFQNGVYVKSGATTRRYVGSFRTTGVSGQTEDSVAKRYVWNYYNRTQKQMYVFESTASWTYTTAAFRQANGSSANQLDCVIGVSEDIVTVHATNNARNGTIGTLFASGIGLDSTTVDSAISNSIMEEYIATDDAPVHSDYRGYPGIGRHFFAWLEYSGATGTTTWFGNQSIYKTGIHGNLFC